MVLERALYGLPVGVGIDRKRVLDVYPLDHEYPVLGLDLGDCLAPQPPLSRLDLTRLQRASEGPGQSPAGSRDHVVERRRPLHVASSRNAVVIGDLVVHTELDRLLARRKVRTAQGTADALDPDPGAIDDLGHRTPIVPSYRALGPGSVRMLCRIRPEGAIACRALGCRGRAGCPRPLKPKLLGAAICQVNGPSGRTDLPMRRGSFPDAG